MTQSAKRPSVVARHRYQEIADELREKMRDGQLKAGDRLPSFEEMRAQGISQNTMEKVHALLAHDGLVVRRPRLGTFVTQPHERQQRTGIIGLGSFGFSFSGASDYWSRLMQGMQEAAGHGKIQILLLDPLSSNGWEKVDGVLLANWACQRPAWLPETTPCVSVLTPIDGVSSVITDDYAGMRAATERLLALGHTRIAVLHGGSSRNTPQSASSEVMDRRMRAYRDTLGDAGIVPDARWERRFRGPYDYGVRFSDRGREHMTAWLAEDWHKLGCTAILAHNDEVAVGISEALQAQGLRVPSDVSVIGFDGTEICEIARPRLASVEIPLKDIGKAAVEILVQQIESGVKTAEHQIFPVAFKEGESIAAPPL